MIRVKRAYEPAAESDGKRFLVDRLWPRGVKKEALKLDGWPRNVAPSDALRHWFHRDPAKWKEFQQRYRAELAAEPSNWQSLLESAQHSDVTLLFSARDLDHNNATVLKAYLEERLSSGRKRPPRKRTLQAKSQYGSRQKISK